MLCSCSQSLSHSSTDPTASLARLAPKLGHLRLGRLQLPSSYRQLRPDFRQLRPAGLQLARLPRSFRQLPPSILQLRPQGRRL